MIYYGYNGEFTNVKTGLRYLRARYYNAENGTFTTEDDNFGTTEKPLTRNRYNYTSNNPVNYNAPTGHSLWKRIKRTVKKVVRKVARKVKAVKRKIANTVRRVAKRASTTTRKAVKRVVHTAKKTARTVSRTVRNTAKAVKNAATHLKQTYHAVRRSVANGYQKVVSKGSRLVCSVSNGVEKVGKTYTSFKSYVAEKTSEIRSEVVRQMCTTTNRITDQLGKVNWKNVAIGVTAMVVSGAVIAATGGLATGAVLAALPAMGGLGTAIVSGAVIGAIGGASYSAVSSGLSGNNLNQVAQDTLSGGLTGAVTGGVLGGLTYGAGKAIGVVKDLVKGSSSSTTSGHITEMATKNLSDIGNKSESQLDIGNGDPYELLKKHGIEPTLSEEERAAADAYGLIAKAEEKTSVSSKQKGEKPYSNSRPSFRKGIVDKVWNNAKDPDGLVRDPNTGDIIEWEESHPRKGVWDMGHLPSEKYSTVHDAYMNGELSKKEFLNWYNDPDNYRPELPGNNRSHKFE